MTGSLEASAQRRYYDTYWSEEGYDPLQVLLPSFRRVLERNLGREDRGLDVGCGRGGGASAWLHAHARSYVGVDISPRAVEEARSAGLDARVIDDAADLPFADGAFDLVLCAEVLEHLVHPLEAVAEIRRVLRPGGRLIVTVPNVAYWRQRADMALFGRWNPRGDAESTRRPWRDPHLRFFGRGSLRSMLTEAGFAPVLAGGHGGPWLTDVPGLRRLKRRERVGPVYALFVALAPSLFAHRYHAVATKPHED